MIEEILNRNFQDNKICSLLKPSKKMQNTIKNDSNEFSVSINSKH